MRDRRTIEELTAQVKNYLDCPCTYFPPMADDRAIMDAYWEARSRGEQEGFVPMLVAVDDVLLESLEIGLNGMAPAQVRQVLLSAPLSSGKELLQDWLVGEKKSRREYWAELLGEQAGGEPLDRLQSIWNYTGKGTVPLLLAQLPVKHPWEVFACLPFGGWNDCPANEDHMAVAKYWYETYGAVPAALTHDVLEYVLPAPVPQDQALHAALEQFAYCADIVDQGVETIGRLADGLARSGVWFFWWD